MNKSKILVIEDTASIRNSPLSPPSAPVQRRRGGPPTKSKFLAAALHHPKKSSFSGPTFSSLLLSILIWMSFQQLPLTALEFTVEIAPEIQAWQSGDPSQQILFNEITNVLDRAFEAWSSRITDDITIRLKIKGNYMGLDVLASAGPYEDDFAYSEFIEALGKDVTSQHDRIAVEHLPDINNLEFYRTGDGGLPILDSKEDSNPRNNEIIAVPSAIAKAIGLRGAHSSDELDGVLNFNQSLPAYFVLLNADFDRSDGISPGKLDAQSIVEHEIGHALGFVSPVAGWGLYPLSLFRFSGNTLTPSIEVGGAPYFSIDGGVTKLADFSNGLEYGASHWAESYPTNTGKEIILRNYGIMGPKLLPGSATTMSRFDLLAMDVIGYDIRPSPLPEKVQLKLIANNGVFSGIFTTTSAVSDGGISIIPDYTVQTSFDLVKWEASGNFFPEGLVDPLERQFEVVKDSSRQKFFRLIGRINLPNVDLSGQNLGGALLTGANLENADLTSASLREANLNGANLRGANLTTASLRFASLKSANFSNCNLTEANLFGADLEGAIFDGATFENTIMPDGTITMAQ